MLAAFGLEAPIWRKRFEATLLLAAAIHDIGKANDHFQKVVKGLAAPDERQPIRHEWISVWIALQPDVKEWLRPAINDCEFCWHVAMYAVSGHHPKHNRTAPTDECLGKQPIDVLTDHPDFRSCLTQLENWFRLSSSHPQIRPSVSKGAGDRKSKDRFFQLVRSLNDFWHYEVNNDPEWTHFCAIVKATLIAADVAGSALWEQIETPRQRCDWITSSLRRHPSREDLKKIVKARLGDHSPHQFQNQIAASTASVTLVEAGCGSGKTAAAYMWAADQQAGKRLWFCYPTTGTATEGYKGYLFDQFSADSGVRTDLFHSRRQFDIEAMLDNGNDSDAQDDSAIRVDSLKAWDTQIVACTVDSVLMLLQNQRKGIYAWPALANAAIVFDEIHCYDDCLFGNLLTWIEKLAGIPVLLMTASLPEGKREAIRTAVAKAGRSFEHIPNGPIELESLPRYVSAGSLASNDYLDAVEAAHHEIDHRGRVLWISNTVDRTKKLRDVFDGSNLAIYHSRFIYKDRVARHQEVTDLFGSQSCVGIASTSQVAEMSLDLAYATLLVTELAPIPALIQRLGRLNRHIVPDQEFVARRFIVIEPLHDGEFLSAPYEDEELELARQWLVLLGDDPVSQLDLVGAWRSLDQSAKSKSTVSRWITGGSATDVGPIRESSYGITVIRKCDLAAAKKEGTAGYALPMNRPPEFWKEPYPCRGYSVASEGAIYYDAEAGGEWSKFNNF